MLRVVCIFLFVVSTLGVDYNADNSKATSAQDDADVAKDEIVPYRPAHVAPVRVTRPEPPVVDQYYYRGVSGSQPVGYNSNYDGYYDTVVPSNVDQKRVSRLSYVVPYNQYYSQSVGVHPNRQYYYVVQPQVRSQIRSQVYRQVEDNGAPYHEYESEPQYQGRVVSSHHQLRHYINPQSYYAPRVAVPDQYYPESRVYSKVNREQHYYQVPEPTNGKVQPPRVVYSKTNDEVVTSQVQVKEQPQQQKQEQLDYEVKGSTPAPFRFGNPGRRPAGTKTKGIQVSHYQPQDGQF